VLFRSMLDERAEGDPLEGSRIMLAGRAEEATADDLPVLRRRYLNAHPSAEAFVNFKDFSFFRIRPSGTHLVAGFGRIVDLSPAQLLTDISDAGARRSSSRCSKCLSCIHDRLGIIQLLPDRLGKLRVHQ